MDIEILCRPGQSMAKVQLEGGEKLVTEPGAMLAMDSSLRVESTARSKGGGIWKAVKRMFAGESFFINTYTAPSQGGKIYLAPTLPGDMVVYELDGTKELIVQNSSYVACGADVEIDLSWQGFKKAFFSGEAAFWIRLSGRGKVILNSFGAIYEKEIQGEYIVDTGHIVAFENTMDFTIQKAGKTWFSSIMGGEGLVCKFSGRGKLFCQTHNPSGFGWALSPHLKPRDN
ncbi:MAG: TIGR00266 family protein [Planctomycetota bacterium]|nr:MAG: TIGR00266 family protein [Planctomycetota bacterium]